MIDNFKILLNIKSWKQHVQLQLKSTTRHKNIIRKINAIVRLKKKQTTIYLRVASIKIIEKRNALILAFSGYQETEFFNALVSAFFLLIIIKINYYCIFHHQIPFKVNLLLLLGFWGFSLYYNVNFYIRFIMYKVIRKSLSKYFFSLWQSNWEDMKEGMDINEEYVSEYSEYDKTFKCNIIKLPIDHWYHKVASFIFTLLIQIRLFMLSEPYLFFFGRFIVVYWLLFNKYLIVTYFISLIALTGRYVLLYQENNMKNVINKLCNDLYIMNHEGVTIKATKTNAFIILSAITLLITHNKHIEEFEEKQEIYHFYLTKTDPHNKVTKKYKDFYLLFHDYNRLSLNYKLKTYDIDISYDMLPQWVCIEETKRNKHLVNVIKSICVLIAWIVASWIIKENYYLAM